MEPSLSLINILNFPVSFALGAGMVMCSVLAFFHKRLLFDLFLHPVSIFKEREYYRFITADFVHNDMAHLLVNEIMLFTYGANLESFLREKSKYGSLEFLVIYLVSCLTGTIITSLTYRDNFNYSSAGASGSIIGCLISYMMLRPKTIAFYLPYIGAVENLIFGLFCIAGYLFYQIRAKNDLINNEVHFYSVIGGVAATLMLFHRSIL